MTLTRRRMIGRLPGLAALAWAAPLGASPGVPDGPEHDGETVGCDLPPVLRVRNTVGTDGLGLCVWASTEMMARYLNAEGLIGVFDQMKGERGGGWPDRVDSVMKHRAPGLPYRQYLGPDLAFVRAGIDAGRPVCVTYGYGEFYMMRTIAHMVLCVGMNDNYTAILDNNDPEHIWWMHTEEFGNRFTHPGRQGWAWVVDHAPPPPVPHNRKALNHADSRLVRDLPAHRACRIRRGRLV